MYERKIYSIEVTLFGSISSLRYAISRSAAPTELDVHDSTIAFESKMDNGVDSLLLTGGASMSFGSNFTNNFDVTDINNDVIEEFLCF